MLQVTILSGGLILCDITLPLGTGLSESRLPLGTISKLSLGTRVKKSVINEIYILLAYGEK